MTVIPFVVDGLLLMSLADQRHYVMTYELDLLRKIRDDIKARQDKLPSMSAFDVQSLSYKRQITTTLYLVQFELARRS